MSRPPAARRSDFRYFTQIPTRWSDNDMFGHLNNVEYYRFFEAVIVQFFHERAHIDLFTDEVIPFAAESGCRFLRPLSFPEIIEAGMRVEKIGTSSVRYGIGLFRQGEDEAGACGHWVHVFVERASQRPHPIPERVRAAYAAILVEPEADGAPPKARQFRFRS